MPAPPNLRTNHVDGQNELILAPDFNDLAQAANDGYKRWDHAFNVAGYGAVGNGVADDTAAIEAAIAALPLQADSGGLPAGVIFFPPGQYRVAHAIQVPRQAVICGAGYASKIVGAFADYLFVHNAGGSEGPLVIRDVRLSNTTAGGGCIHLMGVGNVLVDSCHISMGAGFGIFAESNTFTVLIENCKIGSNGGSPVGQVGIITQGHASIRNCDVAGLTTGIIVNGPTGNVMGCRVEVCKTGLYAGLSSDLSTIVGLQRSAIIGNSFEANDTHINIAASSTLLAGCGFQGSPNAPSGQSIYGVRINTCAYFTAMDLSVGGSYGTAAVSIEGPFVNTTLISVQGDNSGSPSWVLPASLAGLTFINCNNPNLGPLSTATLRTVPSATSPAVATAGTITTSGVGVARVTPAAAVTGVILQAGTVDGQQCTVQNEAISARSITFATDATSNVADGLAIVIPGLRMRKFTWGATSARWFTA